MSILVTGGTGFLGTRVIRRLVASGEKVVCFDILPNTADFNDISRDVKIRRGDVTCIEDILGAIQRYDISKIIHLAVQREGLHSAMRISALGTNCVFEAARLASVKRIAFASSVAYHGTQSSFGERLVNENDHGFPTMVYGAIKWMNEFMASAYNTHYGMEIVALRISLVYGWGIRGGLDWANTIITCPAKGEPVAIPYRSNQKVCLIHVDDVAEVFSRLIQKEKLAYDVYHTGGHTCTLGEMADVVKGFIPNAQISFDEQAEDMSFAYLIDNSRLHEEIGIEFRSLREGILQVINTVRDRADSEAVT